MNAYEKGLTIKSLVLFELRDAPMTGERLACRVDQRCSDLAAQLDAFDFSGWVGTTFWGVLETFAEADFITPHGRTPTNAEEWSQATLEISTVGSRFLQNVRLEVPHVLELIEGAEVAQRAVAS